MRYTNLQVGRWVAALAVLVFHAAVHGRDILGVDSPLVGPIPGYWFSTTIVFFFALSGFVLAHGLQTARLGAYTRGRLIRLFPTYWATAAAVFAVRWAVGNPLPADARGLAHAVTLWPCGPNRAAYQLGVEWTLVYEGFLSLAVVPLAALGRRWGLGLGAAVWLASILTSGLLATGGPACPVFPTAGQLPLSAFNVPFLLGVLAYLGQRHLNQVRLALPAVAAVALAAGGELLLPAPGWSFVCQSAGTVGVVGFFAGGRQLADRNRLVRAGDWAYGIYLLHVPALTAFYGLVAWYGFLPAGAAVWVGGGLAAVVSAGYGAAEWAVYRRLWRKRRPAAQPVTVPVVPVRRAA